MFKKVTYTGFEKQPALLTKVQGLVPILDAELDTRLGPIGAILSLAAGQIVALVKR